MALKPSSKARCFLFFVATAAAISLSGLARGGASAGYTFHDAVIIAPKLSEITAAATIIARVRIEDSREAPAHCGRIITARVVAALKGEPGKTLHFLAVRASEIGGNGEERLVFLFHPNKSDSRQFDLVRGLAPDGVAGCLIDQELYAPVLVEGVYAFATPNEGRAGDWIVPGRGVEISWCDALVRNFGSAEKPSYFYDWSQIAAYISSAQNGQAMPDPC